MFNIKILSGPMYGSELDLPQEKIFFVVANQNMPGIFNQEKSIGETVGSTMENTLIIPASQASPNFLLDLTLSTAANSVKDDENNMDSESEEQVQATLYTETGLEELFLPLQQVVSLGNLRLAIKKSAQAWDEAVTNFLKDGPVKNITNQTDLTALDTPPIKKETLINNCFLKWGIGLAALFIILIAAFLLIKINHFEKVSQKEQLIGEGIQSLTATDGFTYLLIDGQNLTAWKRTLSRQNMINEITRLRTISQEIKLAKQSLDNANLPFWKITLQDPTKPEVLTSNQITHETEQKIILAIKTALPYANKVVIKKVSAETIIQQAISLLDASGMPYTIQHGSNAVSITLRGTFDDQQLNTANKLINRFYRQWGDRLVTFKLELIDELLKGGTKKGANGTIEYKQQHIYFG